MSVPEAHMPKTTARSSHLEDWTPMGRPSTRPKAPTKEGKNAEQAHQKVCQALATRGVADAPPFAEVAAALLPVPQCVQDHLDGNEMSGTTAEKARPCLPWLVAALRYAYLDPERFKAAARRLLRVSRFTANLGQGGNFDTLRAALKGVLVALGGGLEEYYTSGRLGEDLSVEAIAGITVYAAAFAAAGEHGGGAAGGLRRRASGGGRARRSASRARRSPASSRRWTAARLGPGTLRRRARTSCTSVSTRTR